MLRLGPRDRSKSGPSNSPSAASSDGGAVPGSAAASAASAAPPPASRQSPRALASVLRAPAGDPAYAPPSSLPPSSAHRPATLRTHLPLPSRLCCTVGARPAAQVAGPWLRRSITIDGTYRVQKEQKLSTIIEICNEPRLQKGQSCLLWL